MLRRVRSSLTVIGREQGLLDAYESEGRGDRAAAGGRRLIVPVKELHRARVSIHREKMKIRECIRFFDESQGDAAIPVEAYDSEGEVDEAEIFCGRCGGFESTDHDDILLCEGFCGRAYHQHCLHPPLLELPPDDEDWLCPACDNKIDAIYSLNAFYEWSLGFETPWRDIFAEEAARGPPSEDSQGPPPGKGGTGGSGLDAFLAADFDTDESDDDDFDPTLGGGMGGGQRTASSSSSSEEDGSDSSSSSTGTESGATTSGSGEEEEEPGRRPKRRRRASCKARRVDYVALNEALFGGAEAYEGEFSEDDGWEPGASSRKASEGGGERRTRVIHCNECGEPGHNRRTCPELKSGGGGGTAGKKAPPRQATPSAKGGMGKRKVPAVKEENPVSGRATSQAPVPRASKRRRKASQKMLLP